MKSRGDTVVETMLNAWLAVAPIRRASIRRKCDVRVYRRDRATVIAHKPGVMCAIRRNTEGGDAA